MKTFQKENREILSEWSHNYLCQLSGGESQCLICKKHIICKAFHIKRHYEQFHKDYFFNFFYLYVNNTMIGKYTEIS